MNFNDFNELLEGKKKCSDKVSSSKKCNDEECCECGTPYEDFEKQKDGTFTCPGCGYNYDIDDSVNESEEQTEKETEEFGDE